MHFSTLLCGLLLSCLVACAVGVSPPLKSVKAAVSEAAARAPHDSRTCRISLDEGRVVHSHSEVPLHTLLGQTATDGNVMLLGATSGYLDLLSNTVCQLRRLAVDNFIVAAFDPDTKSWCERNGIPAFENYAAQNSIVIPSHHSNQDKKLMVKDDKHLHSFQHMSGIPHKHHRGSIKHHWEFASPGFREATKLKSAAVSRVLEEGFNVLWCDVDLFLFEDPWRPLLDLMERGTADILIQSDSLPSDDLTASLNSGFYFVRSNTNTRATFLSILAHTRTNVEQTEQPAFHAVLCHEQRCGPVDTMSGEVLLSESASVGDATITGVLDRDRFPNGAVYWGFDHVNRFSNVVQAPFNVAPPVVVHNNWIKGLEWKTKRLKRNSMWLLQGKDQTCPV